VKSAKSKKPAEYEKNPLDKLDCIHAEQVWKRCEWHCKVCGKVME
jgi:hypothetical protein